MKKPKWVVEKEQGKKVERDATVWLFGLHRRGPANEVAEASESRRERSSRSRSKIYPIKPICIELLVDQIPTPPLSYGLWIGSFLVLALVSANTVVREQSQQTLTILLTTSIPSAALMKKKA